MEKALVTDEARTASRDPGDERTPSQPSCATALLRPGLLAFGGPITETTLHAHHTVRILAGDTPLIVMDAGGVRHHGTVVVVPADAPHRIDRGAARGATLYLDPDTIAAAAADRRAHTDGWTGGAHPLAVLSPDRPLPDQVSAILTDLRGELSGAVPAPRHSAVTEALRLLPGLVTDRCVRGADVARRVGLSPARLSGLFAAEVGLPLRPYMLWLRLRIAVSRIRAGDEPGVASCAAGFDDGAHLTRTCRRTFGLAPASLIEARQWDLDDGGCWGPVTD